MQEAPENYDLLGVNMICLGKKEDATDSTVLKMLFDKTTDAKTKEKQLEDELGLELSDSGKEGMKAMCNLADGLIEQGRAEGFLIGLAEAKAEIRAKAKAKGKAESILMVLNLRKFDVSTALREKIFSISNIDLLGNLIKYAVICTSIDEFEKNVNTFLS